MAKRSVYLETTIVSYLTGRPSRDLVVAARQQVTRDWWDRRRSLYDLYVSELVLDEAAEGDAEAAERRLRRLHGIPLLAANEEATTMAQALVDEGVLPPKAATDAVHIALTVVHGINHLLTWNCTHLANAEVMPAVNHLALARGYEPPTICTPDELMGGWPYA